MSRVLTFTNLLLPENFRFTATNSKKYKDGKKIIMGLNPIPSHDSDPIVITRYCVSRLLIYIITFSLFGRMWSSGISGFNLKNDVNGDEYYGLAVTRDSAPHYPNRAMFLTMLTSNDLPFSYRDQNMG